MSPYRGNGTPFLDDSLTLSHVRLSVRGTYRLVCLGDRRYAGRAWDALTEPYVFFRCFTFLFYMLITITFYPYIVIRMYDEILAILSRAVDLPRRV